MWSITVGALNPPNAHEIANAPTRYTTRGPGLPVGVKPDVAAYGGAAPNENDVTGLFVLKPNGTKVPCCGTSLAAPLVARTLAGLDFATEGTLKLETLRALLIHHASIPMSLHGRRREF